MSEKWQGCYNCYYLRVIKVYINRHQGTREATRCCRYPACDKPPEADWCGEYKEEELT